MHELIGLFVDDGALAAGLVAWCVVVGIAALILPAASAALAIALLLGCTAVLVTTVLRA